MKLGTKRMMALMLISINSATALSKKWDGNSFEDVNLNANFIESINFDNKGNLVVLGEFERTAESATNEDKVAVWARGDRR